MSILYVQKVKEIDKTGLDNEADFPSLDYPVFLASINEPESKSGPVCDWLEPGLSVIVEQWQEWQRSNGLKQIPLVKIETETKKSKEKNLTLPLFEEITEEKEEIKPKPIKTKSKTIISRFLEDLFR